MARKHPIPFRARDLVLFLTHALSEAPLAVHETHHVAVRRYRGKEKLLSLGPYPLVALKDARAKRDEALLMLLDDLDPSAEKKRARFAKDRAKAITFGVIAEEYLEKAEREGRALATMKKLRWLVAQTKASLADLPISEIEAPDVLRTLKAVEANGTYETARRLRSTIGTVFRYAIATGRATRDPSDALKGALTQHNRTLSRSSNCCAAASGSCHF